MADITRTTKVDYKQKGIYFSNGQCVDEDGVVIDILTEIQKIFKNEPFDLSVTKSIKENLMLGDFDEEEDD